jgi:hypothetical protein
MRVVTNFLKWNFLKSADEAIDHPLETIDDTLNQESVARIAAMLFVLLSDNG